MARAGSACGEGGGGEKRETRDSATRAKRVSLIRAWTRLTCSRGCPWSRQQRREAARAAARAQRQAARTSSKLQTRRGARSGAKRAPARTDRCSRQVELKIRGVAARPTPAEHADASMRASSRARRPRSGGACRRTRATLARSGGRPARRPRALEQTARKVLPVQEPRLAIGRLPVRARIFARRPRRVTSSSSANAVTCKARSDVAGQPRSGRSAPDPRSYRPPEAALGASPPRAPRPAALRARAHAALVGAPGRLRAAAFEKGPAPGRLGCRHCLGTGPSLQTPWRGRRASAARPARLARLARAQGTRGPALRVYGAVWRLPGWAADAN